MGKNSNIYNKTKVKAQIHANKKIISKVLNLIFVKLVLFLYNPKQRFSIEMDVVCPFLRIDIKVDINLSKMRLKAFLTLLILSKPNPRALWAKAIVLASCSIAGIYLIPTIREKQYL